MKKLSLFLACLVTFVFCAPIIVQANMAAPALSDVGSPITFERNDAIAVLSEVLSIRVHGSTADITATYNMKNTTDAAISTCTMFLSPNIENSHVTVVVNNKETAYRTESYVLNYSTEIRKEDWRYTVLIDEEAVTPHDKQTVDAVTFDMAFAAYEEYAVTVSYTYRLGGYPDYDFNAKQGEIEYYLTPAAMWKDFSHLTIHLHLDKDMPVIQSSNLPFEKVAARSYRYTSDTLPQENLKIVIDENIIQNFFSSLRSPYLHLMFMSILPLLLIVAVLVISLVGICVHKKKRKNRHLKP